MDHISKLIKQYLAGRHLPETEAKIQQWLVEDRHTEAKDQTLREYFDTIGLQADHKTYRALAKIRKRLGMQSPLRTGFMARKRLLRAAAILLPLMIMAAMYWYINRPVPVVEVIAAYGEQKLITLPDSSRVWLNSGSRLTYPQRFIQNRNIQLSGEAYFSVAKDPKKPFTVETERLSVQVLGTEFNVVAFPDDDKTTTALVSGRIQVNMPGGKAYLLQPGKQLSVSRGSNHPVVTRVTVGDLLAKREGGLVFDNASLQEILRAVERKYNIDINLRQTGLPTDRYSVKFVHNETFGQVMNVLEDMTGGFEWR